MDVLSYCSSDTLFRGHTLYVEGSSCSEMASICSPLFNLSLSRPPVIQVVVRKIMYPSNQQINKSLGLISQDLHILKLTPLAPSSRFLRQIIRDLGIIRSILLKFCSDSGCFMARGKYEYTEPIPCFQTFS